MPQKFQKAGRLYARAVFTGYKRSQRNQYEQVALLKVEGCKNQEEGRYYVGKHAAYVYRCKSKKVHVKGSRTNYRCIWGKVVRTHGNSGIVRAKFKHNLPASAMGKRVRVMMYPSRV